MPRMAGTSLPVGARRVPDAGAGDSRRPPGATPPSVGLRRRQRAVCTFLVAAGVLLGAAGLVGRSAVLVLVLAAQVGLALLGGRLLAAADRWSWIGVVPAVAVDVVLATGPAHPAVVLAGALGASVALVIVVEVVRSTWASGPELSGEVGRGRVERLSQNVSLVVLTVTPSLCLAVRATGPVSGRWWVALGVADVCAGVGVRLGGSIVRAGGLSAVDLWRRPKPSELLRLPFARALGIDTAVTVAAFVVAGLLLVALGVPGRLLWVPALLAAAGTPLVLAGATTVLGTRSPLPAGALAVGLGLAASAPLALLLSVHPG